MLKEKETRIGITSELNQQLDELLGALKAEGRNGITKKKLVNDLCSAGLNFQKQSGQGMGGFTSTSIGVRQPIAAKSEYIVETKSELKAMQEAMYEKENRLMNRELHLNVREEFLNRKQTQYYSEKEQLITDQHKLSEKKPSEQGLNDKIVSMAAKITELQTENKRLKAESITLLKKIDKNTQQDVLKDLILPLLTPALTGYLVYQNKKAPEQGKSDPQILELIESFSKKTPREKKKTLKEMKIPIKMPPAPKPNPKADESTK